MIPFDIFKKFLAGHIINTGWVVNKNELAFSIIKSYDDEAVEKMKRNGYVDPVDRKLFYLKLDDFEKSFQMLLEGGRRLRGGAAIYPNNQSIAIQFFDTLPHRVFIQDNQTNTRTHDLITYKDNGKHGGIRYFKTINGRLYGFGAIRTVLRWEGEGRWACISDEITQLTYKLPGVSEYGFKALDGFSEEDIYAVGGKGDVWHYDGKLWSQIPLPTNESLENVACGDGKVYIASSWGTVFVGRENTWKCIAERYHPPGGMWENIVWFEDRVWCTTDVGVGLWTIENDKIIPQYELPAEIRVCAGHLYVNDGVMLVCGSGGASLYKNGAWQLLYNTATYEMQLYNETK